MLVTRVFVILIHMKENFEQSLVQANELVKKYRDTDTEKEENSVIAEMEKLIKNSVKKGIWEEETASNVFLLQKKKSDVVKELHEKFQEIDQERPVDGFSEGEQRNVVWNKQAHSAMAVLPSGKSVRVSVGELLTDGEWGLDYTLSGDIPRDIRKRFIVAEARRKILALADEQILETERIKEVKNKTKYTPYGNMFSEKDIMEHKTGFIAEKLVKTFFEKNIIDHGLPMTLEEVDIEKDVEKKIDFILHLSFKRHDRGVGVMEVKQHDRGVGEAEVKDGEDIGIQLTVDPSEETHKRKEGQIERVKKNMSSTGVDNIVLVTIPMKYLGGSINLWKEQGMRPGGPMRAWEASRQEKIFHGVLQKLFPENEIADMWEEIRKAL